MQLRIRSKSSGHTRPGILALLVWSVIPPAFTRAVHAQQPPPGQIEEWEKLSPEQKEQLRQKLQAFKRLSPEQQQEIFSNLEQFRRMNPQERRLVLQNYSAFQRLTPEE